MQKHIVPGTSMASSSSNDAHMYKEDLEYLIQAVKNKELKLNVRVAHIWKTRQDIQSQSRAEKARHKETMMMKIDYLQDLMKQFAVRQDANREAENTGSTEQVGFGRHHGDRIFIVWEGSVLVFSPSGRPHWGSIFSVGVDFNDSTNVSSICH